MFHKGKLRDLKGGHAGKFSGLSMEFQEGMRIRRVSRVLQGVRGEFRRHFRKFHRMFNEFRRRYRTFFRGFRRVSCALHEARGNFREVLGGILRRFR